MVYHTIAAFYTTKLIFDEKKIGWNYRRVAEDIMYGESVSIKVMKMEFCFIAPEENLFCCSIFESSNHCAICKNGSFGAREILQWGFLLYFSTSAFDAAVISATTTKA